LRRGNCQHPRQTPVLSRGSSRDLDQEVAKVTVDNMADHRAAIPRSPVRTAVIAVMVALALTAFSPQRAHGDAALQNSSPAAGSALTGSPTEIELTFNEEPLTIGTQILVEGPDGSATEGDFEVAATTVRQPLKADLPDGDYTVEWRIISGDGHPVNDAYTFTLTSEPGTNPPSTAAVTPPGTAATSPASMSPAAASPTTPVPGRGTPSSESTTRNVWWVVGFAVLAVLAGIGSWATRGGDGTSRSNRRR
jgi:methionine-rich copper-binding protein CopC